MELPLVTFDSCELSDTLVTTDVFERLSDIVILLLPLPCEEECWDFLSLIAALTASGWILSAFKVSIGKSATPKSMLPMVLMIAPPPPVMGSQGPSSISYSFGRYLNHVSF